MLSLDDWKLVFAATSLIGVLLFASPTLSVIVHLPPGERFSELWLLGPAQMAEDYPSNVTANVNYLVYVGVGNHMGSSAYYVVYVKFANLTDTLPNDTEATPSPLAPLYEYRVFLEDGKNWTTPLAFSLSRVTFFGNQSTIGSLTINDVKFSVDKLAVCDVENEGYYYQLFLELWVYDAEAGAIQFQGQYVGFWLNVTSTSA
jgi:hypothetical protein